MTHVAHLQHLHWTFTQVTSQYSAMSILSIQLCKITFKVHVKQVEFQR